MVRHRAPVLVQTASAKVRTAPSQSSGAGVGSEVAPTPAMVVELTLPPAVLRHWKLTPLLPSTTASANADEAVVSLRIITPDLAVELDALSR